MKNIVVIIFLFCFFRVSACNKEANDEPDPDMISSGETLNQNSPISEIFAITSNVKKNKNYGSYDKIKEINEFLAAQHINKEVDVKPKTKAIKTENHSQNIEIGTKKILSLSPSSNVRDQITLEINNNTSLSSNTAKVRQTSADDEDDFNKELLSDSGFGESDELNQSYSLPFNNTFAHKFKSNTNSSSENSEREKIDNNPKNSKKSIANSHSSIESNQTSLSNIFNIGNTNSTKSNNVSNEGNTDSTVNNVANTVDAVDEVSKIDRFKELLKISYKPLNDKLSPTKEKEKEKENEKKKEAIKEENVIKSMTKKLKTEKAANNFTSFANVLSGGGPVSHFLTKDSSGEVDPRGAKSKQSDTVNITGSGSGAETDFDGDYNTEDENYDSEIIKKPNLNPMEKSASIVFQENANELGHNEGIDKNLFLPGSNNLQTGEYNKDNSFKIPLQVFGRKNKKHRHIKVYPINSQSYTNNTELLPEEHSVGNIQTVSTGNIQELSGGNKRRKHESNSKKKTVHDPEFNLLNLEQENDSSQHYRHLQENHEKINHNKLFNDTLFEVAGQKANRKQLKLRKKKEGLTFLTSATKKLNDPDDLDNDDDASEYDGAYFKIHNMRRRNVDALMMHRRGEIELRRSLKKKGRGPSADWLRKYWGGESEENGGDISLILKKRSEIMQDEVEVPSGIGSNLGYEDRVINATLVTERILSEMNLGESAVEQIEKSKDFGLQDPTLIARENESVLKTDRIKSKENIDRPKHHLNHHPRSKRTEKDNLFRKKRDIVLDQLKGPINNVKKSVQTHSNDENDNEGLEDIMEMATPHILKQSTVVKRLQKKITKKSKIPHRHSRMKRSEQKVIANNQSILSKKKDLINGSSVLGEKRLNIPFEAPVADFNSFGILDLYNMEKMSRLKSVPFFGNKYDIWNPEEAKSVGKFFTGHPPDWPTPDVSNSNSKSTNAIMNGIIAPVYFQSSSAPADTTKILTIAPLSTSIPDNEKVSSDELEDYVKELNEEKKKEALLAQEGKTDLDLEQSKSLEEVLSEEVKPNDSIFKNKTKVQTFVDNAAKAMDRLSEKSQNIVEPIDGSFSVPHENQSNIIDKPEEGLMQKQTLNPAFYNLNIKNQLLDNLYSKALSDSDEIKSLQEHTYSGLTSPSQAKYLNDQISEITQSKAEQNFREMEMDRVQNELQIRNQYATSFPIFSVFDGILKKANEEEATKKHSTLNKNVVNKTKNKTVAKHLKHLGHLSFQITKKRANASTHHSGFHDLIRHFVHAKVSVAEHVSNQHNLHKGEGRVEEEPLSKRVKIKDSLPQNPKVERKSTIQSEEKQVKASTKTNIYNEIGSIKSNWNKKLANSTEASAGSSFFDSLDTKKETTKVIDPTKGLRRSSGNNIDRRVVINELSLANEDNDYHPSKLYKRKL